MLNSKEKRRFHFSYIAVPIGVFLLGLIVWQFYKYRIVHQQLDKTLSNKSGGLYSIHYEGLVLDEVRGILHVKNITIVPDTAIYRQMTEEHRNPPALIRISIPALDILGVKTPKALLGKQIEGGKLLITNPAIVIELDHFSGDSTIYNPGKDLSKDLLGKLLKISLDSVEVAHAKVLVRDMGTKETTFSSDNVSFLLSDLLIDSIAIKDSSRILFSRNLDMSCNEIIFPTRNEKYRLHVEKLQFAGRENNFHIGRIGIVPQLSEAAFAGSSPVQKDRYDFEMEGITLRNVVREGLWHKQIRADSLIVNKSSFKVYRDLSYPRDTVSKVGRYPQQLLMRLHVPVNIKKMVFLHSFIEYKEKNAKSDSAGKLQFFDVSGTFSNVTNMKAAIDRNNECTLLFRAKLLDKTPVDARLVMLLKDPKGKFRIEGNIGGLDVVSLNGLTQPMGLTRMEKGKIDNLHFDLRATDSQGEGKLIMLYSDLKISLLKKDKKENKYDKKGLASLAANIFIKNSNPGKGENPRTAEMHFDRILDKSFFNLIWKTLFTGIKQTVGMKK